VDTNGPAAGLCADCQHARRVESSRQATFYLCKRSETDPSFPKYPRLPVIECAGYEPFAGSRNLPRSRV